MVEAEALHKWFGKVHAVRGVGFRLDQGEVVGLLGHNGAGKSTTIRMLTGCTHPDQGSVAIAGLDVTEQRVRAARLVGYLPESTPLYHEMRAGEYVSFRARVCGVPARERTSCVARVMEQCWLSDVRERRIGALSKGYKQRVGLAASLVHDPKVLVLDEPTSGLDPAQVRETRDLIKGLSQQRTVLISSHVLPEVEQLCTRVIIMAGGSIRADGSIASLLRAGSRTFIVEAKDADEATTRVLLDRWRAIPGLEQVRGDALLEGYAPSTRAPGWRSWRLDFAPFDAKIAQQPAPLVDPREAIAHAAMASGVVVRELRSEGRSLERVFLDVLEQSEREEREDAGVMKGQRR